GQHDEGHDDGPHADPAPIAALVATLHGYTPLSTREPSPVRTLRVDPPPIPRRSIETLGQIFQAGIGGLDPPQIARPGTSKWSRVEGVAGRYEQTASGCET
ncbi:hypothetical protein AB1L30_00290, partial [Bremerella sp. JC817]|uniref:hypothetical protein n=1 Tax=Bremerella sp. JC817 TaxID=3231756 RepID=UPI0034576A84